MPRYEDATYVDARRAAAAAAPMLFAPNSHASPFVHAAPDAIRVRCARRRYVVACRCPVHTALSAWRMPTRVVAYRYASTSAARKEWRCYGTLKYGHDEMAAGAAWCVTYA
ncbi:hypothetical protein NPIL_186701 [Nephila pilipes]|uniref:Uncharacterized protein n=1 Tax=Nephila pilipes TaxID=299642 RepID=A0A8X6MRE5_NEPPI|nr:hypothetical protein NPIL_186701 [Nephila pilipes]